VVAALKSGAVFIAIGAAGRIQNTSVDVALVDACATSVEAMKVRADRLPMVAVLKTSKKIEKTTRTPMSLPFVCGL
jgi:hypothetical protein